MFLVFLFDYFINQFVASVPTRISIARHGMWCPAPGWKCAPPLTDPRITRINARGLHLGYLKGHLHILSGWQMFTMLKYKGNDGTILWIYYATAYHRLRNSTFGYILQVVDQRETTHDIQNSWSIYLLNELNASAYICILLHVHACSNV